MRIVRFETAVLLELLHHLQKSMMNTEESYDDIVNETTPSPLNAICKDKQIPGRSKDQESELEDDINDVNSIMSNLQDFVENKKVEQYTCLFTECSNTDADGENKDKGKTQISKNQTKTKTKNGTNAEKSKSKQPLLFERIKRNL